MGKILDNLDVNLLNVNPTTCKRFLLLTGIRVSNDSVSAFQQRLKQLILEEVEKVKQRALTDNAKTVNRKHII